MKRLAAFSLFILPFFLTNSTWAQGLLWDDEEYMKLPVFSPRQRGEDARRADLSPNCPTPGDQCSQLSCVGWAISYAMTIRRSIQCKNTSQAWKDAHMHSPAYIYNQVKEGKTCDSGAYLTQGLDLAMEQGVCLLKMMPYKCCCCSEEPEKKQKQDAANRRISGYRRIFGVKDTPEARIEKTMDALAGGNPVIVALMVTSNFKAVDGGHYDSDQEDVLGDRVVGHAVVVVGYDAETRLFILLNSYGTTWGEGGFVKMSYNDFGKQVRYGAVITLPFVTDCKR